VIGVLTTMQTFFLVLNNFIANPFQMLAVDKLITAVPDGNGLSPLLQYPAMAIHPPMLYLGYVGFAVPFAFAIGSLITRSRATPGSTPRAAGRWSPGCSRAPASCWARRGRITCWAGAATGVGTRWRTLPCSPGSAARRFCTR
jgi:cytochrome c biogenesis factor